MLTARLARFVCGTKEVPPEVLRAAKVALMDTFGCALAGYGEPAARLARERVTEIGARSIAGIWGAALASAPAEAAFANAVATHVLDFDDTLAALRGHPSATTLPVALAVGEQLGASGRKVLTAYSIGIEVAGKLGRVFGDSHYLKGWHNTATVGTFAATAVAARLHGLDEQILLNAWGIAAAQCGGVLCNFGTMSKSFQAGHAAHAAVVACDMAHRGFTANQAIFDGDKSFQRLYGSEEEDASHYADRLGAPWEMIEPGMNYKRWPCCYCSHRALAGISELIRENRIRYEEITKIRVGFPPGADEPLIHDDPHTALEAKFSIQYPIAALTLEGTLNIQSFTDEAVRRPMVRAMMQKVERYRVADSGVYSGTVGYTDIAVETARGTFARRVDKAPGSRVWPIPQHEHEQKFLSCAAALMSSAEAERLLALIMSIDIITDVRELSRAAAVAKV